MFTDRVSQCERLSIGSEWSDDDIVDQSLNESERDGVVTEYRVQGTER